MLGQLALLCAVDPEEDDEDGEGELVAAFAMAAPPPTSTPAKVSAARAFRIRVLMIVPLPAILSPTTQDDPSVSAMGRSKECARTCCGAAALGQTVRR